MTSRYALTRQKKAKIQVYNVGLHFGCESRLRVGRKTIWTSRTYPYGWRHVAYAAAEAAAQRLGLEVAT